MGVTDIADILNLSRQNIRKLIINNQQAFPLLVHEGKFSIWHLAKVLMWMKAENRYRIKVSLFEVSDVAMQLNISRETSSINRTMDKQSCMMA